VFFKFNIIRLFQCDNLNLIFGSDICQQVTALVIPGCLKGFNYQSFKESGQESNMWKENGYIKTTVISNQLLLGVIDFDNLIIPF